MAVASDVTILGEARPRGTAARWGRGIVRFVRRKPLGAFGAIVILILLFFGFFADVVAPQRYDDFNIPERLQSPSNSHFFGTDNQGRDVFSRVLYGSRTTVQIGFGAVAL